MGRTPGVSQTRKISKRVLPPSALNYYCEGPYEFGPAINKVCCHGWNHEHYITERDVNTTQHLINCGVILTQQGQKVTKVEDDI